MEMDSRMRAPSDTLIYAQFVFLSLLFPLLALFSMYFGEPRTVSIFPATYPLLLVFLSSVSNFGGGTVFLFSVTVLSVSIFYIFCHGIFKRKEFGKSRVLFSIFLTISIFNFSYIYMSLNYSLEYQGKVYSYLCAFWNLVIFISAALLYLVSCKKESYYSALVFRWILVAWPISFAFPWMGETF